jgi:hypothetical protein
MNVGTNRLQNQNTHDETISPMLGLPSSYRHVARDSTSSMTALGTCLLLCRLAHAEKHHLQPASPVP